MTHHTLPPALSTGVTTARYGAPITRDTNNPGPKRRRTTGVDRAPRRIVVALAALSPLLFLATSAVLTASDAGSAAAAPAASHVDPTSSWTVYHGNPLGTGVDTSGVTFSPPNAAWTSPVLDGQLYGEPLEATGRVYAATENDTMYAVAANTGAVLWHTHVGTPVPSGDLPCGDIGPTVGITGTPVVDAARGEVFAVADELVAGAPAHFLLGFNMYNGTVDLDVPVDPPGQNPADILQRTGLNLSNGNVVFGYGGNDGDCATYSGWVVGVPEGGGTPGYYQAVPIGHDGAVWMGGAAPEVDSAGNIWVATGNGSASTPYDYSDSVLELSPGLIRTQYFAPSTWQTDNSSDFDLGSSPPALLSNGTILQVGKSSTAYLLNQASLGGIGGQIGSPISACGSDSDGGDAISGTVVYVPCGNGVQAIQTSPLGAQWQTSSGTHGPPITAGGLVWSLGGSTLYGLDPTNGDPVEQVSVGGAANHFPTPSVGDGLLFAPSTDQVHAFSGSVGLPGPPSPPPPAPPNSSYWMVASDGGIFTFGNAGFSARRQPGAEQAGGRHGCHPATAATGWSLPTGASSRSVRPSSTGRWAEGSSTNPSWGSLRRRTEAATGSLLPTAGSSPSATQTSSAPRGRGAQQAGGGHDSHPMGRVTGSSLPTGASSPSVRPSTTAPWAAGSSTCPSSGSLRRPTVAATGSSPPTGASSRSVTPTSPARPAARR